MTSPPQPRIYLSERILTWSDIGALPRQWFEQDWYGKEIEFRAGFVLACDPGSFWFCAETDLPPRVLPGTVPGAFQPGLWQGDVAECFWSGAEPCPYWEWNLAPGGAWWTAEFEAVRIPREGIEVPSDVDTWSGIRGEGWCGGIRVSRSMAGAEPEQRFNICMILTDREGVRRFLSWAPGSGSDPDFHRPERHLSPMLQKL